MSNRMEGKEWTLEWHVPHYYSLNTAIARHRRQKGIGMDLEFVALATSDHSMGANYYNAVPFNKSATHRGNSFESLVLGVHVSE